MTFKTLLLLPALYLFHGFWLTLFFVITLKEEAVSLDAFVRSAAMLLAISSLYFFYEEEGDHQ